jgi:hypothetical protein
MNNSSAHSSRDSFKCWGKKRGIQKAPFLDICWSHWLLSFNAVACSSDYDAARAFLPCLLLDGLHGLRRVDDDERLGWPLMMEKIGTLQYVSWGSNVSSMPTAIFSHSSFTFILVIWWRWTACRGSIKQGRALHLLSGLFVPAILRDFRQARMMGSGSCLQQLRPWVVTWQLSPVV